MIKSLTDLVSKGCHLYYNTGSWNSNRYSIKNSILEGEPHIGVESIFFYEGYGRKKDIFRLSTLNKDELNLEIKRLESLSPTTIAEEEVIKVLIEFVYQYRRKHFPSVKELEEEISLLKKEISSQKEKISFFREDRETLENTNRIQRFLLNQSRKNWKNKFIYEDVDGQLYLDSTYPGKDEPGLGQVKDYL